MDCRRLDRRACSRFRFRFRVCEVRRRTIGWLGIVNRAAVAHARHAMVHGRVGSRPRRDAVVWAPARPPGGEGWMVGSRDRWPGGAFSELSAWRASSLNSLRYRPGTAAARADVTRAAKFAPPRLLTCRLSDRRERKCEPDNYNKCDTRCRQRTLGTTSCS